MRALLMVLLSLGLVAAAHATDAVTGRVIKVLPLLLDGHGRDSTSPSLLDRDAYQAYLLQHPKEISAIRYDVLWKAVKSPEEKIKIALELRGIGPGGVPRLKTMEVDVTPGKYRQWTEIPLADDEYQKFGAAVAWRVTLWNGGRLLGEKKSFLW